jgi:hypothetical protein
MDLEQNQPGMPPQIILGSAKTIRVRLRDKRGLVLDPSTMTEITATLLNQDGSCLVYTKTGGKITLETPVFGMWETYGWFDVNYLGADTLNLAPSPIGPPPGYTNWEIHYTIAGQTYYVNIPNALSIVARNYPTC